MSEEVDLGIIEPTHVHKVGLAIRERTFNPFYSVSIEDINTNKYNDVIFLERDFPVNPIISDARYDNSYKQAKEVAFKLNIIYEEILATLNAKWELELFMDWLEGNNTAFDIFEDAYRDLNLIKGDNYAESTTESTTESEGTEEIQSI